VVDDATARRLNALNLAFYRDQADAWDAHRASPWPGWERLLSALPEDTALDVLDVGCGNGRFGRYLAGQREVARYVGIDACEPLLRRVREAPPGGARLELVRADFIGDAPDEVLPAGPFHLVTLFGVLHHVPSDVGRRALVAACAARVGRGGLLALAAWRFAEIASLRERALAPEEIRAHTGLDPDALGPADFLMPFGPGRNAVRYARAIDAEELAVLTDGLGLEAVASYVADGRDAATNRYRLLQRPDA
jgi:SAM-dependent methyltransferase